MKELLQSAGARRRRSRWFGCASVIVAASALLGACSSNDSGDGSAAGSVAADGASSAATKFVVVVSDQPIADLVKQVAGPAVEVRSVVPVGADGHTYEPTPEDARTLAEADIYIENGYNLNNVVTQFAVSNYPEGTQHHVLSEVIPPGEVLASDSAEEIASHGHAHNFNAHFWPDPVYASWYVTRIDQILQSYDPADAPGYSSRAQAFMAQLQQMDQVFRQAIDTIPAANRKLVVYHDSWSHYGRRYNLPVIGAIQPTDFSEPSAEELRATIDEVRAQAVPAFFGSEVFPSDVLDVIAQETGAKYVADLSDDRLPGDPGTPQHSYVGMMVANTRAIVSALGGNASMLDPIDPAL